MPTPHHFLALINKDMPALKILPQVLSQGAGLETTGWRIQPSSLNELQRFCQWVNEARCPVSFEVPSSTELPVPIWVDLAAFDQIQSHPIEEFMITTDTGITVQQLDEHLQLEGQVWPLHYPNQNRLIDILAEDRPSLETGLLGYPRDTVCGVQWLTPNGELARYGGEVTKNVTGYDMKTLLLGSAHQMGLLTQVTLKVIKRPAQIHSCLLAFEEVDKLFHCVKQLAPGGLLYSPILNHCEIIQKDRINSLELFPQRAPWRLWLKWAGHAELVESVIQQFTSPETLKAYECSNVTHCYEPEHEPNSVEERLLRKLIFDASTLRKNQLVLEVALPHFTHDAFYQILLDKTHLLEGFQVQIRPFAGLFYLVLEGGEIPEAETLLLGIEPLRIIVSACKGTLRCVNAPPGYKSLLQTLNLPPDSSLLGVTLSLKERMDPNQIFYGRSFPLN